MPLKHLTETVLVVLLAIVTIVTGILVATLPLLPQGLVPAVVLLIATLIYAFGLYPLLRRNRADNEFRWLHGAPALIVVVWLAIQIAALKAPGFLVVHRFWTWGWSFPAVLLTFLLLAAFSLHVIRRRLPRLSMLGVLLVPFAVLALLSERGGGAGWHGALAGLFWRNVWSQIAWSGAPQNPVPPAGIGSASSSSQPIFASGSSSSRPPHLATSGPDDIGTIAVVFLAAYCGVLHERARRRVVPA